MEKEGFLLDIDYITEKDEDGNDKPVIRLWCKSEEGADFIVLDKNFEPYFYAFPYSYSHSHPHSYGHEWDVEEKKGQIEKICVNKEGGEIRVKRVEFCQKKLLGVNRRGLKIFAEHPRHVPLLREEVRKVGITVLEADILFAFRYLIDKQLRPFDGVKAEGEEIEVGYADTAILASKVSYNKMNGGGGLSELKIIAFDCEMATLGGYGMPSAKKDPIIIIAVAYNEENEVKTKLFVMNAEEYESRDDEKVLRDFLDFVEHFQPDVIVGYNSDGFDWQYIKERARLHGIRLSVGADGSTVQYEKGGALPGVNITGRLNVDLFKLAKRDLDSVKVKTLENVAEFLGVMRKNERVNLSPREINDCWIDSSPSSSARERLYEYARADAVSTLGVAEKMLPLQIELSKMIGYPLDELAKMGRGRQVEAFLTAEAFKKDELVPPKKGAEKTFEGGFVLPPEKGLHEDVISLDFSSMYPTIMISFNISPDTFVESKETEEELYIAPEVGHAFKKAPDGFFKRIMSDLITRRKAIKAEMKSYDKTSNEYRLLDIQQQSVKILTNSFYGYTGWSAAKFYKRECAEATTAWGRYFIKRAIRMAEELGFEVIYGDTDSIFAKLPEGDVEDRREAILKKAKEVSERISKELPLELEIQDFFKAVFFTGKKKRYAALTDEGEIMVRGLEVRRGDWCELAKEVQTEVIDLILREKDPDAAMKYTKSVIQDLKEGKVRLDKLIIYKTLTRKISDYETKQAHVIAAERALASRIVYEVGSKIPYVILKGVGKTSDRAFPVDVTESSEGNEITAEGRKYLIDVAYYVQHQVIPVAHRVLQLFGYDISSFEEGGQKTLGQWF